MATILTKNQQLFMDMAKRRIESAKEYPNWMEYELSTCEDEEERRSFKAWMESYYSVRVLDAKEKETNFKALKEEHITDAHGINRNTLKALEKKGFIQILSMPENEWESGRLAPTWIKVLHF